MRADVLMSFVVLSHEYISFLSEGYAEGMLNVYKRMFSFVKLHNVNSHIFLAFVTQMMGLWVFSVHRIILSSALEDCA
jgi:hypothetical protein